MALDLRQYPMQIRYPNFESNEFQFVYYFLWKLQASFNLKV